jgi:hypothetical protein
MHRCGKMETPSIVLLPFRTAEYQAWLQAECWSAWSQWRREETVLKLTEMGITMGRKPR